MSRYEIGKLYCITVKWPVNWRKKEILHVMSNKISSIQTVTCEKYGEFEELGLIYVDLSWVNKSEHKLLHNLPLYDSRTLPFHWCTWWNVWHASLTHQRPDTFWYTDVVLYVKPHTKLVTPSTGFYKLSVKTNLLKFCHYKLVLICEVL